MTRDEIIAGLRVEIDRAAQRGDIYLDMVDVRVLEAAAKEIADAAPVVRCKDCLYFCDMSEMGKTDLCSFHSEIGPCGEIQSPFYTIPEAFCAWSEQRDGGCNDGRSD